MRWRPLASFTVFGASAAAEWQHRNGLSLALGGDAEVASRTQTYSGNGTLRYVW